MNHAIFSRLVIIIAISWSFVASTTAAELTTLGGKRLTGAVTQIDPSFVSFQETGSSTPTKIATKDIASIELRKASGTLPGQVKFDEAELTDGSQVRFSQIRVKGKSVEVTLLPSPEAVPAPIIELPLNALFWLMRGAEEPKNRDDWKKLLATRGKRDLFVIRQPDGLNPLAGTVIEGTETGEAVQFEREDGQKVSLKLVRATGGIVFNQTSRDVIPATLCKVTDVFGNLWHANTIEIQSSRVTLKTVSGATVAYESLAGVTKLDFSQGNLSYLSELDPVIDYPPVERDGQLGEQYPYAVKVGRDRATDGAEISLDGRKFTKGLSIPPDTILTYKLDGTFRELKALAGIPDGTNRDSWSLKLRIEVDGRRVFEETITKKARTREITLNVKDAKELKIIVERDSLFLGNQLNLAEARLQK